MESKEVRREQVPQAGATQNNIKVLMDRAVLEHKIAKTIGSWASRCISITPASRKLRPEDR